MPAADTSSSSGSDAVASTGRILFWAGAGFCTVAAPWMLGGQPLLAQWLLLAGAAVGFIGGILVHATASPTAGARTAFRVQRVALVLGLLFVGYVAWQAMNPTLTVIFHSGSWTLLPANSAYPGPHSIQGPFNSLSSDFLPYKNAARFLLIYGAAWLFAASLALGLKARADVRRWVFLIGANGVALALVCLVHRALGEKRTLWHFADTVAFTGSPVFFYKNHNGAFLAASLAAALSLAWSADNSRHRRLWEGAALFIWCATVAVNSRAAAGVATAWLLCQVVLRLLKGREVDKEKPSKRPWLLAVLAAGGMAGLVMLTQGRTLLERFSPAVSSPADFVQGGSHRGLLRELGIKIWLDDPVWGWGGGAFMYLFPNYESRVPELRADVYRTQPNLNRFYMFSVDSDWVEFLVEYGVLGVLLLAAAAATALLPCLRWRIWNDGSALFLLLAGAGIILHAYLDHILRNPALFFLLCGATVTVPRLAVPGRTEHHRRRIKSTLKG